MAKWPRHLIRELRIEVGMRGVFGRVRRCWSFGHGGAQNTVEEGAFDVEDLTESLVVRLSILVIWTGGNT